MLVVVAVVGMDGQPIPVGEKEGLAAVLMGNRIVYLGILELLIRVVVAGVLDIQTHMGWAATAVQA